MRERALEGGTGETQARLGVGAGAGRGGAKAQRWWQHHQWRQQERHVRLALAYCKHFALLLENRVAPAGRVAYGGTFFGTLVAGHEAFTKAREGPSLRVDASAVALVSETLGRVGRAGDDATIMRAAEKGEGE